MAYHELTIATRPETHDDLAAHVMSLGCLGVIEQEDSLIAYFPDTADADSIIADLRKSWSTELQISCTLIPHQDWNESWKKGFKPLNVGSGFTILPPWEQQQEGRINLIIEPAMAFGTGHHETTRSCLVLLEKYAGYLAKDRFLDLGTGTGLLAIAASKLGFEKILAVDTDPLATEAARLNSDLNSTSNIEIRDGSIDAAPGKYDCITANIISGVLIMLAPALAAHLQDRGVAILSGILTDQAEEVITEMQKFGLAVREQYRDDKWISLVIVPSSK